MRMCVCVRVCVCMRVRGKSVHVCKGVNLLWFSVLVCLAYPSNALQKSNLRHGVSFLYQNNM